MLLVLFLIFIFILLFLWAYRDLLGVRKTSMIKMKTKIRKRIKSKMKN
jgi:hypothetical protein